MEPDDARRIATAAYNSGLWPYYHFTRGEHVDSTTTGHDYSRDVYDRSIEFADLLSQDETEPDALTREVELQGKYAKADAQKRAGVQPTPDEHLSMGEPMEDQAELVRADYHRDDAPTPEPKPEEAKPESTPPVSESGPKLDATTEGPAVQVTTVTASKESSIKRLWTALGLGGVGLGTYATQLGGWFKNVDPGIIKWVILIGLGAVVLYLVGQFVNGLFDRWSAHKLNVIQAESAQSRTANTIQFVPPEAGTKP